jgi:hypothetical protein
MEEHRMVDVLVVLGLFVTCLVAAEGANRTRNLNAAFARGLAITGWVCSIIAAFVGWTTFDLHIPALQYVYDAMVLAAVSVTANRR